MQYRNSLKSKYLYKRIFYLNCLKVPDSILKFKCSCSVYIEGDIETRVYNDSINGEVKSIPEICVRRDGMTIYMNIFFS